MAGLIAGVFGVAAHAGMATMIAEIAVLLLAASLQLGAAGQNAGRSFLQMYVDELPRIPKIYGYSTQHGSPTPTTLTIGMYAKKWKFHRDLPDTTVFVYGTSAASATFPGPTIEALQGVPLWVTWENHLPPSHILPWDPTVLTAIPKHGGVPAVVHLHGGVHEPQSDGSPFAWFTADYGERGPEWTQQTYHYPNAQQPGNHWYHDHALGLTRVNLLAGLIGSYIIRSPLVEGPFGLPGGDELDQMLVIVDRSFSRDGSIYMNATGVDPSVHPHWQPEYFGDAVVVNGKAWPYLRVQRRRYRFRIVNSANARYFHLSLSNGLRFVVVGSDSSYLPAPVTTPSIVVSPAEMFDVVIDFSQSAPGDIEMTNDASYPYPAGTPASYPISKVMKFIVSSSGSGSPNPPDNSRIPPSLVNYPAASASGAALTRYISLYDYTGPSGHTTHLDINRKRLLDSATEKPKVGSTEVWEVINLTSDDHPLHLHLVDFQAVAIRGLANATALRNCMMQLNDAVRCNVAGQATGSVLKVPEYERAWKNVVKIPPGNMTTVIVKFHRVDSNEPYPFDATARPGYVYHCHILDHEDNEMIRPLVLVR